ncbi:MAG: DUF4113 domain-containing protein [Acidobacteria bacterium]|nr:DUF4113 domain-containing protein [Acidobacteriota bacterium]
MAQLGCRVSIRLELLHPKRGDYNIHKQNWQMNRNYLSPGYTTDITKLLRIGL